jgi:hypothetical protein
MKIGIALISISIAGAALSTTAYATELSPYCEKLDLSNTELVEKCLAEDLDREMEEI